VALTHLADTSVLKRLADPNVRAVVEPLTQAGHLARAAISDLEIGYSARNSQEWDRLISALGAFDLVETTTQHVTRSLQVQRLLASRSQRGRKIPDLLIAAAAEALNLIVLHYDADFDLISAVTEQKCQWVVSAGSID
jgi:predicted nucleic acid-binding protein